MCARPLLSETVAFSTVSLFFSVFSWKKDKKLNLTDHKFFTQFGRNMVNPKSECIFMMYDFDS